MSVALTVAATTVQVPDHGGLIWPDERGWQDVIQTLTRCFGGQLVAQHSAAMLGGQPMTLTGGQQWAWCYQSTLDALIALLAPASAVAAVTLDDGRQYTAIADRTQGPAVQSYPLPLVADSPLIDRDDNTIHVLESIRLLILAGPL